MANDDIFVNALNAPNNIQQNPEWTQNVFTSLGVTPDQMPLFEQFVAVTLANAPPGTSIDTETFYDQWKAVQLSGTVGGSADLSTYQAIYNTFFPDKSANFLHDLADFLFRSFRDNGQISPSALVSLWFSQLTYYFFYDPATVHSTYLDANNSDKVAVMLGVFRAVIDTVDTLQKLAVAQASRLDFYAKYQQSYTDLMANIPQFLPGQPVATTLKTLIGFPLPIPTRVVYVPKETLLPGGGFDLSLATYPNSQYNPINATDFNPDPNNTSGDFGLDAQGNQVYTGGDIRKVIEGAQEMRSDAATLNSKLTEGLRSYRSIVTSDAQLSQTSMGQTNAAVNQQTDMASQILSTISDLIRSLFKQ